MRRDVFSPEHELFLLRKDSGRVDAPGRRLVGAKRK
jgi:hypothetical protein